MTTYITTSGKKWRSVTSATITSATQSKLQTQKKRWGQKLTHTFCLVRVIHVPVSFQQGVRLERTIWLTLFGCTIVYYMKKVKHFKQKQRCSCEQRSVRFHSSSCLTRGGNHGETGVFGGLGLGGHDLLDNQSVGSAGALVRRVDLNRGVFGDLVGVEVQRDLGVAGARVARGVPDVPKHQEVILRVEVFHGDGVEVVADVDPVTFGAVNLLRVIAVAVVPGACHEVQGRLVQDDRLDLALGDPNLHLTEVVHGAELNDGVHDAGCLFQLGEAQLDFGDARVGRVDRLGLHDWLGCHESARAPRTRRCTGPPSRRSQGL